LIGEAKPYSKGISITVNGLTVIINTDPALGPVTVVDDSVDLNATLSTGSRVEVHAIQGANGLVATRIEESPVTGDLVRGIVKAVSGAFAIATIGDLQVDMSAVPSAQTKALVVGQTVTVFGTFDATNSLTPFKAKRIHSDAVVVTSKVDDYLGGFITQYTASNQTFVINGVNVDAATATIKSSVVLANGQYVRVRGTTSGAVFKATSVQLRKDETQSQGGDADLIGNILGLVPPPVDKSQPATLLLRGVFVTVPSTVAGDFTRCGASALANGMYVEVKGNTTASGVTATSLLCDNEPTTAGTTVERVGTVAADSPSANTVTAGTFQFEVSATETITVVYNAQTFFRATPSTPLDGTKLKAGTPLDIEGVFSVTGTGTSQVQVLRATKIKK
jgi:cold shock CspA family protein